MYDTYYYKSYDLIMQIDNTWTFKASDLIVFRGKLQEVVRIMVEKFDFEISEIECALAALDDTGDDTAHFGTYRSFLFTLNTNSNFGAA